MKKGKCDFHAERQGEFRAKNCMFLTLPSDVLSLWRNRLARSAVNRKVGGSSPPRDDSVFLVAPISTTYGQYVCGYEVT